MVGLAEKSPKPFSILERSASEKGTCTLTTPSAPATSRKGANTVGGCGQRQGTQDSQLGARKEARDRVDY